MLVLSLKFEFLAVPPSTNLNFTRLIWSFYDPLNLNSQKMGYEYKLFSARKFGSPKMAELSPNFGCFCILSSTAPCWSNFVVTATAATLLPRLSLPHYHCHCLFVAFTSYIHHESIEHLCQHHGGYSAPPPSLTISLKHSFSVTSRASSSMTLASPCQIVQHLMRIAMLVTPPHY